MNLKQISIPPKMVLG